MAEQLAELNKDFDDIPVGTRYEGYNASAVNVTANVWTRIATINTSTIPKGKYLVLTKVSYLVNSKVLYARLCRNNDVNYTTQASPYGSCDFSAIQTFDGSVTSMDLFYYGQAVNIPASNADIQLIRIA